MKKLILFLSAISIALSSYGELKYVFYMIGDGSGVTHSLSHASASGVYVAREILEEYTA